MAKLTKSEQDKINLDGTTHGLSKHPLYSVWAGIKRRCFNKRDKHYHDYGGRGITMCDQWMNDFKSFYDWAIDKYQKGLFIDREDVNGNYEPSNCRFVTVKFSNRNTRVNTYIEFRGETKCMAEWAEVLGLNYKKLSQRINRDKWPIERALTTK